MACLSFMPAVIGVLIALVVERTWVEADVKGKETLRKPSIKC